MASLNELEKYGQSWWLGGMNRSMILSGNLRNYINSYNLKGAVFSSGALEREMTDESYYEEDIANLSNKGLRPDEIYDHITIEDAHIAAQEFWPLFKKANGSQGFVSIEIPARFANSVGGSIDAAMEAKQRVNDLKNILVQIPGTPEGYDILKTLTAQGVSVMVTCLFSLEQYVRAVNAYWEGLREFIDYGGNPADVNCFATVVLDSLDYYVDKEISRQALKITDKKEKDELINIRQEIAISNAKLIYGVFEDLHRSKEWRILENGGGRIQRLVWGGTDSLNGVNDVKYIEELIGKNTVSSIKEDTANNFIEHGKVRGETVKDDVSSAKKKMNTFNMLNLSFDDIAEALQRESLFILEQSYENIIENIYDITESGLKAA